MHVFPCEGYVFLFLCAFCYGKPLKMEVVLMLTNKLYVAEIQTVTFCSHVLLIYYASQLCSIQLQLYHILRLTAELCFLALHGHCVIAAQCEWAGGLSSQCRAWAGGRSVLAANSSHMLLVRGVRWRLLPQPKLELLSSSVSSAVLLNLPQWCGCTRCREFRGGPWQKRWDVC